MYCALGINCWALQTLKPSSNLTCQGNILCSGKSSDNALQTPTRNTLRLFGLFHLLHGFNQTGLCIFKWEPIANTGIPFSIFLFLLTPRIQVDFAQVFAEPYQMSLVSMQDPPPFSYQLSPSCSQLGVSQVFQNIPWGKKKKPPKPTKQPPPPLLGVQEYRWNSTHLRSYKTINSKKINYLSFYASLCRLFLQHPAQDKNIQPCVFQATEDKWA